MRTFRIALWGLVALVAVLLAGATFVGSREDAAVASTGVRIGGPFELVDQRGETVTRDDLIGTPHAVFFGYTFCPDVCPTTLWEMSEHLEALGDDPNLKVVFVSVDPERDTPEALADYVSAFDERILALTGPKARIDEAVGAYRATYTIHEPDERGDVLIDHTASVMLFDETGTFRGTIAYGEDFRTARAKLERLTGRDAAAS